MMWWKASGAAAFAARRATLPALTVTGAFSSAAWFGAFELAYTTAKLAFPPPTEPHWSATAVGVATVPASCGAAAWVGWKISPPWPLAPAGVLDIAGWLSYARQIPVAHVGSVGVASAVASAVVCRAVQYNRGG